MADPHSEWTHPEQIELDGITYTIAAEQIGDEYIGKWHCHGCGQRGDSTLRSPTPKRALERAKISLFAHHTLAHSEQSGGPGS